MAPPLVNWKRLIDNGNSNDGPSDNVTELVATAPPTVFNDLMKWPQQPSTAGGGLGSDLLPVYCGVLGCLIVGLVAWIVFKQLRRPPAANDDKLQLPSAADDVEPGLHDPRQLRRYNHRHRHQVPQDEQQVLFHLPLMRSQKRRSADSGFYGSETAAVATAEVIVYADIRRRLLRDLSESRLLRLENILANDPNPDGWRRLAKELGLSADDLDKLECHQSARGNQSAIRLMLKTWAARDSSSVGQLIRCLQRAGRSDALILFREPTLPLGLKRKSRKLQPQQQQLEEPQMGLPLQLPCAETAAAATASDDAAAEVSADTADVNRPSFIVTDQ